MYNLPESPGVCRENFLQRCLLCRTAVRCYHKMEIPSWKNKY